MRSPGNPGQIITAMRKIEKINHTFLKNKKRSLIDAPIFISPGNIQEHKKTIAPVAGAFSFSLNIFSYQDAIAAEGGVL